MVWRGFARRKTIVWLLALQVLAQPGHAGPAAEAVIAEAATALEAGDAAHALQLADDGLRAGDVTPLERGRLLLDRGLAHELLGAHDEALQDFTAALQTHVLPPAEQAQALLQRGFLLDGLDRLDDAAKDYTAVVALKSDLTATALNNRANIWRRENRLADARRDYLAALAAGSIKPQYPYYGLGQIAEAQHDSAAARGFYGRAVAADPRYSLAADRLAALGGPPEGTLSEPDRIVLHPPGAKPTPQPVKAAVLHPSRPRHVPPALRAAAVEPGLRPALDGPSAGSGLEAQLGAWRSEPEAQAAWQKARSRAGAALQGFVAHVVMVDLPGKGRYFRLRVATSNPNSLCAALKRAGLDCVPVRG